ncbi:hypothetical protein U1Q18_049603 [Sarracenia purpurea var. burkii]
MAETLPIMYDYLNPDLATLQQLSINAVTVQLWRWKINKRRTNNTMNDFYCSSIMYEDFPLQRLIPKMPPAIYHLIEEYVRKFGLSLHRWLHEQFYARSSFKIFHDDINDILGLFDDFVCDNNGTIHNVHTAKRMLLCDRISQQEKFQIACEYCFEDDIRQIWPSVSSQLDLKIFSSDNRPLEYYWISRIINQLCRKSRRKYFQRGFSEYGYSITDEKVLVKCPPHAWPSFQYFWHRLTLESQWRVVSRMFDQRKPDFAKLILPMLNEDQLDEFVTEKGTVWICDLIKDKDRNYYLCSPYNDDEKREWVLSTWTYLSLRNKIHERHFVELTKKMFDTEAKHHIVKDALNDIDKRSYYDWNKFNHELEIVCFCEIWSIAPLNLRLSATEQILRNTRLSKRSEWSPFEARETRFLMKMLTDATSETKKTFWDRNWYHTLSTFDKVDLCDGINEFIEGACESADLAKKFKNQFSSLPGIQNALTTSSFKIFHNDMNDILGLFDDFVCDNNGTIHDVRTAKRMLLCDRISQQEKFQIACQYCFEDDIRQIWPSVSGQLDLEKFDYSNQPLEYYWISRIINQLSRKSRRKYRQRDFAKVILPMLSEEQLDRLVAEKEQKRKHLKQQFLQSNFRAERCIFYVFDHLGHCDAINEFIEDAYEDADLATEFKKQFTSLPAIQHALVNFIPAGNFSKLIAFVDTFVVTDKTAMKLKLDFLKELKSRLVNGTQRLVTADRLQNFLGWCLGDADQVIKFKQSISPVDVVHNTARNKNYFYCKGDSLRNFNVFLEWYFHTTVEVEQFKRKYSNAIEKFS